ncbi:hypothetical protein D9M71_492620 [compost metagenome]
MVEALLTLPDLVAGAAVLLAHLREVLPGLTRQLVELDRALGKALLVEAEAPAQHAAQILAGIEHLLEQGLALAQRRVGVDAVAGSQGQAAQGQQQQGSGNHGNSRVGGGNARQYPRIADAGQVRRAGRVAARRSQPQPGAARTENLGAAPRTAIIVGLCGPRPHPPPVRGALQQVIAGRRTGHLSGSDGLSPRHALRSRS